MPSSNPEKASKGGDATGMTKTDPDLGSGSPIDVANASFDPGGYDPTMEGASLADLKRGYCTYGKLVGESEG
jgi:hypothetical protein